MRHNYVIFGSADDYYRVSYNDMSNNTEVKYLYKRIDSENKLLTNLYRFHTSPITNRFFKLPGQKIWNRMAFRGRFDEDKPLCFVFFIKKRLFESGLIEYLRRKYQGCKIVLFCQDLVAHSLAFGANELFRKMDLCLSFDHADAEKYGMDYYPLVYSPYDVPEDASIEESDVYFVGKAKDRLPQILAAYERFRDAGLKCDFYITGVKPEDQKYADEITYGNQMPYIENLKHIKKTKCLLEIMQGGGHGYTLRACEAIMYDKKMITDNPEISKAPFYRPKLISVFSCAEDIDPSFVTAEPTVADYGWKENLSPLRLLKYIDVNL